LQAGDDTVEVDAIDDDDDDDDVNDSNEALADTDDSAYDDVIRDDARGVIAHARVRDRVRAQSAWETLDGVGVVLRNGVTVVRMRRSGARVWCVCVCTVLQRLLIAVNIASCV
jgi:hypothetical protein